MNERKNKSCRKCGVTKELTLFKTASTCVDGYRHTCKECANKRTNELLSSRREEENKKRHRWVLENPEKRKHISKKYYENNKDKQELLRKAWRVKNIEKARAQVSARRKRVQIATPKWAEISEIEQVYLEAQRYTKTTGILHTVDHIIPLRGKLVSGLHVKENLQVLPYSENYSKSARFII